MAVDARRRLVRATQGKIRVDVMIEMAFGPRFARMAGRAISPVVAIVMVILKMTADAFHVHRIDIIKWVFTMAITAGQHRVLALERKVGVAGMVETRISPRAGVVTGLALLSAATVVTVIPGVAAEAGHWCIPVRWVVVAVRTFRFTMFADQGKIGRIVIKPRVTPVTRIVTIHASSSQVAFMSVIFEVAIDAIAGRGAALPVGHVASATLGIKVFSL